MVDANNLLLLFDRPLEPVFAPKGTDETYFNVPPNFLTNRYQTISNQVQLRFGENANKTVQVNNIAIPNMDIPMSLGRKEQFSLWIPRHRRIAGRLIDIFMGMRNLEDLQSCAAYARDRVNPLLFNYAMCVTLLHRPDTKRLTLPSFVESFPDRFVDSTVFASAREEATMVDPGNRMPIVIPRDYTSSNLEDEHRLWYFREDLGVNLHHWHWHLVYPSDATRIDMVDKDRRGELFYYMHSQLVSRYNLERFSNNLPRVKRLNNFRDPIAEGYFPKMDSSVASRAWPARAENTVLRDLNRELDQIKYDVADLERWRDGFYFAVTQGYVVDVSRHSKFSNDNSLTPIFAFRKVAINLFWTK
jgi:tyrosinase